MRINFNDYIFNKILWINFINVMCITQCNIKKTEEKPKIITLSNGTVLSINQLIIPIFGIKKKIAPFWKFHKKITLV